MARHSRRSAPALAPAPPPAAPPAAPPRARRGHRRKKRRSGPLRAAVFVLGIGLAALGTHIGIGFVDDGPGRTQIAGTSAGVTPTGTATGLPDTGGAGSEAAAGGPGAAVQADPAAGQASGPAQSSPPPAPAATETPAASTPPASTPPETAAPSPRMPVPVPSASSSPPADAGAYEEQVLAIVNNERAAAGCGPLQADTGLRDLARAHSADMADRAYFSHNTPEGTTPWERASAAGVGYLAAENIARGQKTPEAVMAAWMDSPGHRRNILDCSFDKLGVGVRTGSGGPWWTQEFGR
ncbi:CAP domain-containing protein [Yinghuangia soli]|uniref:CAP domain-containing protein n=1 Tax=Yinghuangia soli TaxID=2908204 RepID=A0AA41Q081_9ACTN|nr:CAP domain-containing protein [Yinghuangia soli]MCF2528575.1 CAP domain-containing protein [Yinghuangia soli]